MKQDHLSSRQTVDPGPNSKQQNGTDQEYQHEVLKHIVDIGASLRLHMDINTLLKRVSVAACQALDFHYSALYLSDGAGYFRVCATSGVDKKQEKYLAQHPLPSDVVALLVNEEYRISDSYFIPAEAPIWRETTLESYFVIMDDEMEPEPAPSPSVVPSSEFAWNPEDLMIVPLVSGDNTLLGFLTPDAPLNGLRPTIETMALLELFANQAAVVIEGARLYEEMRQASEERAALIEIGRALSTPDAMHDLQTVYRSIYEQVRRVMPADAFFVSRYYEATDTMVIDYLIDKGVIYPPLEYDFIRPRLRQLLYQDRTGRLFSTAQEYMEYRRQDAFLSDGFIGTDKPSESLLFAPIRYAGKPLGLLSAQSYQPHAYTQRQLEMLKEIGIQAGIAITNARLYTELRDAIKKARASEQLKDHFLLTASHELRTPLTAIQGYLELLGAFGSSLDEASKTRFINNARRACEELIVLLGNVMDTSRIDQDRVVLNLESIQAVQTVRFVLEILEPTIAREERTVEVHIPDELHIWVDHLRLRQILINLVGNALKYTPARTAIAISAESILGNELCQHLSQENHHPPPLIPERFGLLRIRDWGSGISPEDQGQLFTKFMRLESAINSPQRGAGLGLYICRQLTEAMGGYIWVESAGIPGEGSSFFIALPQYISSR